MKRTTARPRSNTHLNWEMVLVTLLPHDSKFHTLDNLGYVGCVEYLSKQSATLVTATTKPWHRRDSHSPPPPLTMKSTLVGVLDVLCRQAGGTSPIPVPTPLPPEEEEEEAVVGSSRSPRITILGNLLERAVVQTRERRGAIKKKKICERR